MGLKEIIEKGRESRELLLMTHQILGYPSFQTNREAIAVFHEKQVELVELQIPFSEPIADGPLFLKANQEALDHGVRLEDCFRFIEEMNRKYPLTFLVMTYYNIPYRYGVKAFVEKCRSIGVRGLIIPDAPHDEATELFQYCRELGVSCVGIGTAYTSESRLKEIGRQAEGFLYYVPRAGVTGTKTDFNSSVAQSIKQAGQISGHRIGVGFGIQGPKDIAALKGVADIGIIGSQVLRVIEAEGIHGLREFFDGMNLARG